MLTDLITIPLGASPELEEVIHQFNSRLSDLYLTLAQNQGSDGLTPSFSSNLDLQGKQIANVGQSANFDDAITSRTARSKSVFRSRSSKRTALKGVYAADMTFPDAVSPNQAVPLRQAEDSLIGYATEAYVDNTLPNSIADVTASRALDTVYQNTSTKVMHVYVTVDSLTVGDAVALDIGATNPPPSPVSAFVVPVSGNTGTIYAIVPIDWYYSVVTVGVGLSITHWFEVT